MDSATFTLVVGPAATLVAAMISAFAGLIAAVLAFRAAGNTARANKEIKAYEIRQGQMRDELQRQYDQLTYVRRANRSKQVEVLETYYEMLAEVQDLMRRTVLPITTINPQSTLITLGLAATRLDEAYSYYRVKSIYLPNAGVIAESAPDMAGILVRLHNAEMKLTQETIQARQTLVTTDAEAILTAIRDEARKARELDK